LKELLGKAVDTHLDADVPVGLFLSGGWDSSLVSMYASQRLNRPLKSYSLVFPDNPHSDESRFARQVARQIQIPGQEIEVREADVLNAFGKTIAALEEPVFTVPTSLHCLLSEVAGDELKVVLTGQGSDELFGGYRWLEDDLLHRLRRVLPNRLLPTSPPAFFNHRWSRATRLLCAPNEEQAHMELLSSPISRQMAALFHPDIPFTAGNGAKAIAITDATRNTFRDVLDLKLSLELTGRLADGILFSDEKISMHHSLETRMPFLDLEVVQFAHRLPSCFKIRKGCRKAVLSSLARELPSDVAKREKQGLHVPPSIYCSEPLRKAYRETILETSLSTGIFDHPRLESWVGRLASTSDRRSDQMRPVYYFCLWWNQFIQTSSGPQHDN